MSIKFECVSCGKPIEIDEQWALKLVECPYCHDHITAPGISTLRSDPVGPAVADVAAPNTRLPNMEVAVAPRRPRRALGVIALVLAIVSLAVCVTTMVGFFRFAQEHVDMAKYEEAGAEGVRQLQAELNKAMMSEVEAGNLFIQVVLMGFFVGMLLWLAGVICAIVALATNYGRAQATVALIISGAMMVCPCLGLFV